jgi:hypothetical protein
VKEPVSAIDAASDVLELWYSDPRYLDGSGEPRALPLQGETASLESLSLQVAPKLPVREVLRHLLRPSVLRQTPERYVPCDRVLSYRSSGSPYHARSLRVMNETLSTLVHNGNPRRSIRSWMELCVINQQVPTRDLPVLAGRVRENGRAFLVETGAEFKKSERAASPTALRKRVVVGLYWFEGPPLGPDRPVPRRRRRPK